MVAQAEVGTDAFRFATDAETNARDRDRWHTADEDAEHEFPVAFHSESCVVVIDSVGRACR